MTEPIATGSTQGELPKTLNLQAPLYLYLIEFGEGLKVGVTSNIERRLRQHAHAAKSAGVHWEPLKTRHPHLNARANERAVVRRFGQGGTSEFFAADAGEVLRFISTLPCVCMDPAEWERLTAPLREQRVNTLKALLTR